MGMGRTGWKYPSETHGVNLVTDKIPRESVIGESLGNFHRKILGTWWKVCGKYTGSFIQIPSFQTG